MKSEEVREKLRKKALDQWKNNPKMRSDEYKQKLKNRKRRSSVKVSIYGQVFNSLRESANHLKITDGAVVYRIKSSKYPNYKYYEKEMPCNR